MTACLFVIYFCRPHDGINLQSTSRHVCLRDGGNARVAVDVEHPNAFIPCNSLAVCPKLRHTLFQDLDAGNVSRVGCAENTASSSIQRRFGGGGLLLWLDDLNGDGHGRARSRRTHVPKLYCTVRVVFTKTRALRASPRWTPLPYFIALI